MKANRDNGSGASGGDQVRGGAAYTRKKEGAACAPSAGVGDGSALPPQPVQCAMRPQRPLLLWDGQCDFCKRWATRLKRLGGRRIDCQPYQQRLGDFSEIAPENFSNAVFLILPDGRAYHSAQAVYRALALRWPLGVVLWAYQRCPHFARFSDRRYRVIAARRHC